MPDNYADNVEQPAGHRQMHHLKPRMLGCPLLPVMEQRAHEPRHGPGGRAQLAPRKMRPEYQEEVSRTKNLLSSENPNEILEQSRTQGCSRAYFEEKYQTQDLRRDPNHA